jgi:hypothetical protein
MHRRAFLKRIGGGLLAATGIGALWPKKAASEPLPEVPAGKEDHKPGRPVCPRCGKEPPVPDDLLFSCRNGYCTPAKSSAPTLSVADANDGPAPMLGPTSVYLDGEPASREEIAEWFGMTTAQMAMLRRLRVCKDGRL